MHKREDSFFSTRISMSLSRASTLQEIARCISRPCAELLEATLPHAALRVKQKPQHQVTHSKPLLAAKQVAARCSTTRRAWLDWSILPPCLWSSGEAWPAS
jgi:hypothetical protein